MSPTAAADLLYRPVTELADLVRTGEVTSRELVEASLDRIEALNPTVNAFVALDPERALEAADAIGPGDERPFAGVPRSEEHTSELQSQFHLVCRLLLEKKKHQI